MGLMKTVQKGVLLRCWLLLGPGLMAQSGTTWARLKAEKKGQIVVFFAPAEAFIEEKATGLSGIEYDLMQDFVAFLRRQYALDIKVSFQKIESFSDLYQKAKVGEPGAFFISSFSITPERQKEVRFSPPYMPDIEVLISSLNLPLVKDTAAFVQAFGKARGVAVRNSTYAQNLLALKKNYLPGLQIEYVKEYQDIRLRISEKDNYFSFSHLEDYLLNTRRGLRLRRQNVFKINKIGRGILYSRRSDWDEPIQAYFARPELEDFVRKTVEKYFGPEESQFIWKIAQDKALIT